MATEDYIPVVDFAHLASSQDLSSCAQVQELHSAFSKVGFVFVKNHGIERETVEFHYIYANLISSMILYS